MPKVIRVVRMPGWDESMAFELTLPRGAFVFKVDDVFTGAVDVEGKPIGFDGIFMLVTAGESATETRRFLVASLASGIDDLTSETVTLPATVYRFIGNLRAGYMLFEDLDPAAADAAPPVHAVSGAV
jgi:hypothetical protein